MSDDIILDKKLLKKIGSYVAIFLTVISCWQGISWMYEETSTKLDNIIVWQEEYNKDKVIVRNKQETYTDDLISETQNINDKDIQDLKKQIYILTHKINGMVTEMERWEVFIVSEHPDARWMIREIGVTPISRFGVQGNKTEGTQE